MNYLTVDLFCDFECIADNCPNTCCAGWRIVIDEETYQKMIANENHLGISAKDWLMEDNGQIIVKSSKQRCPMLTEHNLCNVVLKLGPQYLSNTCTQYPRMISQYGNTIEGYLNMSCPDVIDKLMKKDQLQFDFVEDDLPYSQYPYTRLYLFESAIRSRIVAILQKFSDISLSTRVFVAFSILDRAIQSYQNNQLDYNTLNPELDHYFQQRTLFSLDVQLGNIVNEISRHTFLQKLHTITFNYTVHERFVKLVKQTNDYLLHRDLEDYLTDLQKFRKVIRIYDSFYTNYWVYRIFSDIITIPDYDLSREKIIFIAAEFCLIQTIALVTYTQKNALDKDEYIYIISCISRMMEHDKEFRKKLITKLAENNAISTAGLLLMILV